VIPIQIHLPPSAGETLGDPSALIEEIGEWMPTLLLQLGRRVALQLDDDLFNIHPGTTNNEVHVIGKNRTSPDRKSNSLKVIPESSSDRPSLFSIKLHGRPFQRLFRRHKSLTIGRTLIERNSLARFDCTSITEQFPRSHKIRP